MWGAIEGCREESERFCEYVWALLEGGADAGGREG